MLLVWNIGVGIGQLTKRNGQKVRGEGSVECNIYYGVYNSCKKEFQFGICEPSKCKAMKELFKKIGKDAYKWRFEIKPLRHGNPKAEPLLQKVSKYETDRQNN